MSNVPCSECGLFNCICEDDDVETASDKLEAEHVEEDESQRERKWNSYNHFLPIIDSNWM